VASPATEASGGAARTGLRRLRLAPDLSLLISTVTLGYCLFLFDGPRRLFRDADTGWHIRTGETILATAALPRSDPYSFTRSGRPWLAWEWGADVLMGTAHRMAGPAGVALLYAIAIAAGAWLWVRLHWTVGGNFWLACAMAAPMLSTTNLHWLARPHVLSWLLMLLAVWYAERAGPRFRAADAAWILCGSAVWANVHASFPFAPAVALLYAFSHLARPWIWELDRGTERRRARWFLWAAGFSALGTLLNPYGWNLHRHVWEFLSQRELLSRIGEYQSFNFHAEGALQILLSMAIAALGGVLALGQGKLAHFLLSAALLATAMRSARAIPLVALLLLPLANGTITESLRRLAGQAASGLRAVLRGRVAGFLGYSERLRAIDARLNGALLAPVIVLAAFAWIRTPAVAAHAGFPPDQFPVSAGRELEKLPPDIRLLHPDKYGGFLIYRFRGTRKVYFDGRFDFYGPEYMKAYARLVQLRPGWRDRLEEFGFTHALLPNDYALVEALEQLGWRRLYRDEVASLLARP